MALELLKSAATSSSNQWTSHLMDARGIGLLPSFTGSEKDWSTFKFKLLAAMALIELEDVVRVAQKCESEIKLSMLSPDALQKSKVLYNVLVHLCTGKPLTILKVIEVGNGLEAGGAFVPNTSQCCLKGKLPWPFSPSLDSFVKFCRAAHVVEAEGDALCGNVQSCTWR